MKKNMDNEAYFEQARQDKIRRRRNEKIALRIFSMIFGLLSFACFYFAFRDLAKALAAGIGAAFVIGSFVMWLGAEE